jgi:histone-lysine N-methyltransferase SETMAR
MAILGVEYRSVIKFFVMREASRSEILAMLQETYKDECPCARTIYYWISEFKSGRVSVLDESKPGRPIEIDEERKKNQIESLIKTERRITVKNLAKEINVSVGRCHEMIKEMGVRKLCSRFVPYFLSAELCEKRLRICEHNLALFEEHGDSFLKNIITEDETPLSLYIPESKRSSAEWKFLGEKPTKKLKSGTIHRRNLMLSIFWDSDGVINIDFADRQVKINSAYYSTLIEQTRKLRRKKKNTNLWLLHDNAPIHTANLILEKIDRCGFSTLEHPAYSPDLAPSDFYLFRHLKKHLAGKFFVSSDSLKEEVSKFFDDKPKSFFNDGFFELPVRWKKCINNNGSYIEK